MTLCCTRASASPAPRPSSPPSHHHCERGGNEQRGRRRRLHRRPSCSTRRTRRRQHSRTIHHLQRHPRPCRRSRLLPLRRRLLLQLNRPAGMRSRHHHRHLHRHRRRRTFLVTMHPVRTRQHRHSRRRRRQCRTLPARMQPHQTLQPVVRAQHRVSPGASLWRRCSLSRTRQCRQALRRLPRRRRRRQRHRLHAHLHRRLQCQLAAWMVCLTILTPSRIKYGEVQL